MYHSTNGLFVESLTKTPQIITKITGCFPQPDGKTLLLKTILILPSNVDLDGELVPK